MSWASITEFGMKQVFLANVMTYFSQSNLAGKIIVLFLVASM